MAPRYVPDAQLIATLCWTRRDPNTNFGADDFISRHEQSGVQTRL
jgi:hypothetical protein